MYRDVTIDDKVVNVEVDTNHVDVGWWQAIRYVPLFICFGK